MSERLRGSKPTSAGREPSSALGASRKGTALLLAASCVLDTAWALGTGATKAEESAAVAARTKATERMVWRVVVVVGSVFVKGVMWLMGEIGVGGISEGRPSIDPRSGARARIQAKARTPHATRHTPHKRRPPFWAAGARVLRGLNAQFSPPPSPSEPSPTTDVWRSCRSGPSPHPSPAAAATKPPPRARPPRGQPPSAARAGSAPSSVRRGRGPRLGRSRPAGPHP